MRENAVKFGIFLIIPLLLFIWFQKQVIYGGGESGLAFYHMSTLLQGFNHTWSKGLLGNYTSWVLANAPFFWFFSLFEKIGIPDYLLQALFFGLTLLLSGIGIYLLTKDEFKEKQIAIISVLFYWFNFSAMILIWNRFIFAQTALYGYLPLLVYVFKKGLDKKKYSFVLLTNLILLLGSVSFISVPIILLYYLILVFYAIFHLVINKFRLKEVIFTIIYFILTVVAWLIFNSWWVIQFILSLFSTSYVTQVALTPSGDLGTLQILSHELGNLSYVMRLMHKDFFTNMQPVWGNIYQNPLIIIISFLVPFFVFGSGFIKKKPIGYYFFIFLAIIEIFFAKGIADPFGGIFYFAFTHFRILEAFRNPFEKIVIALPLAYAPLFGFGLYHFYLWMQRNRKKFAKATLLIIIFLVCGILVWPMWWNGDVFSSGVFPTNNLNIGDRVLVPDYYTQANNWLNSQQGDFKVLALPIGGEGINQSWKYGYNGIELSNNIFDRPFISSCTNVDYLCPISTNFEPTLFKYPQDFWKTIAPLNVAYIMWRNDVNYRQVGMKNPIEDLHAINSDPHFSLQEKFDKLSFYKVDPHIVVPKIYGATTGIYFNDVYDSYLPTVPVANYQTGDLYFTDPLVEKEKIQLDNSKQIIAEAHVHTNENSNILPENAFAELPYVRFLPGSPMYLYTRLKENIDSLLAGDSSFTQVVIESDKRDVEIYKLILEHKFALADQTRVAYTQYLDNFLSNTSQLIDTPYASDIIRQTYVMQDSIAALKQQGQSTGLYENTLETLDKLQQRLEIATTYPVDLNKYTSYEVSVPEDGEYAMNLETNNWSKFYSSQNLQIIIDGSKINQAIINPTKNIQVILHLYLTKGQHQIDIKTPQSNNLISKSTETLDARYGVTTFNDPFTYFDPSSQYHLSFNYMFERDGSFQGYVTQDTDQVTNGTLNPTLVLQIPQDPYFNGWRTLTNNFTPNAVAKSAKLVLYVQPHNICMQTNPGLFAIGCSTKNISSQYDKEVTLHIKNISMTKTFNNKIFLTKNSEITAKSSRPTITYDMINPAVYKVTVSNATNPFFLTFLQSYNPLWKAYFIENGKSIAVDENDHILVNSFANSWYIEKLGNYQILLEFYPERFLDIGQKISLYSIIISFIILVVIYSMTKLKNK